MRDYPAGPIPRLSETPGVAQGVAPRLGEHNSESGTVSGAIMEP
jgi:hypothetical protein